MAPPLSPLRAITTTVIPSWRLGGWPARAWPGRCTQRCLCRDPVVRGGAFTATRLYAEVPLPRPRCTQRCLCRDPVVRRGASTATRLYAEVPLPRPGCTQRCLCRDPVVRRGASTATRLYAEVRLPRPGRTQRCLCIHARARGREGARAAARHPAPPQRRLRRRAGPRGSQHGGAWPSRRGRASNYFVAVFGTSGVSFGAGRRMILEPSQTSGSYLRPTTRSFIGMSALSVILMCSGHTSVQHLVMLQ